MIMHKHFQTHEGPSRSYNVSDGSEEGQVMTFGFVLETMGESVMVAARGTGGGVDGCSFRAEAWHASI